MSVPAAAEEPASRVVVVSDDAELVSALTATLLPWRVELVVVPGEGPGSSLPGSARRGREASEHAGAAAAVWISVNADGPALWVYDRESDRVTARPLASAPPFDDVTAAAIALAVKALLRYSAAAPPEERLVAPPRPSSLRIELVGGAEAFATSPGDVEARGGVGVVGWPDFVERRLGLGLFVRAGSGVGLQGTAVDGRYWTLDVHLGARSRWPFLRAWDVRLGLELGATLAWLDGRVIADARSASVLAADPSALVWAELGFRPLPSLRLGLRAGARGTARTRTFLVRGEPVLDASPVAAVIELVVEVPLDGGSLDSP